MSFIHLFIYEVKGPVNTKYFNNPYSFNPLKIKDIHNNINSVIVPKKIKNKKTDNNKIFTIDIIKNNNKNYNFYKLANINKNKNKNKKNFLSLIFFYISNKKNLNEKNLNEKFSYDFNILYKLYKIYYSISSI